MQRWQSGEARNRDALPFAGNGQRVVEEFAPHDLAEPLQQAIRTMGARRQAQSGPLPRGQGKADGRVRHRQPLDDLGDGHGLGPLRAHELEPGRRGREQVTDLDTGTDVDGGRPQRGLDAPVDDNLQGLAIISGAVVSPPRGNRQPRDGTDRRQGLAAKAQRANVEQVLASVAGRCELRRRVAFDAQRQIGRIHPAAIVGDANERQPATGDDDVDLARTGIKRVLDQFLDDAGRPLDHLAGGNAVHGLRR